MSKELSIEKALEEEENSKNEHTFYDVFERYSEDEITDYKRMAGIPLNTNSH